MEKIPTSQVKPLLSFSSLASFPESSLWVPSRPISLCAESSILILFFMNEQPYLVLYLKEPFKLM